MAFIPIPNGAEVVVRGTLSGENVVNTFNFTHEGEWGLTELQALVDAVDDQWATNMLPLLSNGYTYVRTDGRDMRTSVGVIATADAGAGAGTVTGGWLPNNCALAVARKTGLAGRAARGRIFLTGIPVSVESPQNHVTSGFATAVTAVLNGLDVAAQSVNWTEVVAHRVSGGVPLSTAVVYTVLEWLVVDLVLDSMRRRLPGRGS